MNFLKGISLFCIIALTILCVGIGIQIVFPEINNEDDMETEYETATYIFVPNAICSQSIAEEVDNPVQYYLDVEGEEIVVYKNGEETVYMNTGMVYDKLTETLKKEIKEHKTFESIEEVYDFLESYSS